MEEVTFNSPNYTFAPTWLLGDGESMKTATPLRQQPQLWNTKDLITLVTVAGFTSIQTLWWLEAMSYFISLHLFNSF